VDECKPLLSGQLAGLDFKFRDPEAKFDRGRVKGVVAKLMQVKVGRCRLTLSNPRSKRLELSA
jgi:hypothetical protein